MDCAATSPIPIPSCGDNKNDFLQAVEENERNESCLSNQTVLKTPTRCLVFSPGDTNQSVYMSPDATMYMSQEASKLKSPTSSYLQSPFTIGNTSHLHSTCDSSMFQSPNGLIQSSFCSPMAFKSAIASPSFTEMPVEEALEALDKSQLYTCQTTKVDVGVQTCQFPRVADELLAYCLKKLEQSLEWPRKVLVWIKVVFDALCERLRAKPINDGKCSCDCQDKIRKIEEKLEIMEVEMERMRMNQDNRTEKPLVVIEAKKSARSLGPSLPPPPPPPPPPPGLLAFKPIIFTASKKTPVAVTTPRPSVTVQDLLSVRLRKVGDRAVTDTTSSNKSQGPMVTLDQLRSVKLRPRRKTPKENQSPTRTPLTRDRGMRKLRSPGFRKERRPRIDRIPLSTILNMDEC